MKSRTLTYFTAMTLLAVLVAPLQLAAQHTRFTVSDLGTLGGTFSLAAASTTEARWQDFRDCPETQLSTPSSGKRA